MNVHPRASTGLSRLAFLFPLSLLGLCGALAERALFSHSTVRNGHRAAGSLRNHSRHPLFVLLSPKPGPGR